ncbi:hypothetical protein F4225_14140 [Candidatus Poribacteria bacterium]|nr:hypothetical protein [Candidatus Poribacteria bacterium]
MYRKLFVAALAVLMVLSILPLTVDAQEQILGPYLWMIVKLEQGAGGAAATDVDSLAAASNNTVTEEMVAKNGATEGDTVGDHKWTLAELPANGDLNTVANQAGFLEGGLDHITAYGLYTYNSDKAQDVTMKTGSDDSVKVWINGEVAFKNAINRGRSMWQDEFGISLKQGDNLIMIKVSDAGGGWGMHMGITESAYVPINDILKDWLWVITKQDQDQGGAAATDVDTLADASGNKVSERIIARDGAAEGDSVGDYDWAFADLPQNGDLNILVNNAGIESGALDDVTAYGLVVLVAPKAMEVQQLAGSDDSIKVWVNGKVVHTNATNRGRSRWQDEFTADLRRGNNLVMVKVSDRGGGWGMHFGVRSNIETATVDRFQDVEPAGKAITTWGRLKAGR